MYEINYKDPNEETIVDGENNCNALSVYSNVCAEPFSRVKLTLINSGSFSMGANNSDSYAEADEKPNFNVVISRPFYIGIYEVKNSEWNAIMKHGVKGETPVANITWNDIDKFTQKLNASAGTITIAGVVYEYALPSEAEWEFAARGGAINNAFFWGNENVSANYAWYSKNSRGKTHNIGEKLANNFALFDVGGNVAEWVWDCYEDYPKDRYDPIATDRASCDRVIRGGGYDDDIKSLRVSSRKKLNQSQSRSSLGFRLALVPKR